ncbi:ABC transporter ATP-binding protein [Parageobacillus thermoglucosidasius]|uniref:ATP-binding cassette domain-containing protein n=1 Tax=Parageobacillus thermoglucosidasius TaxID=1426 RepID=A0AB38R3P5_PARTM|nr:ATP-binding cassette domain-containing protein [Parageobacillus thermoglucosidasius]UOE78283.1 ATP-binding cassette domain-containing protein [Parageobacillus thermoglucosidasius]
MILKVENVTKRIRWKPILEDINLDISGAYGLVGPNGAGKTTLLRILSTLMAPSKGQISFEGLKWSDTNKVRKIIGYMPQETNLYPNLRVSELLEHFSKLKIVGKPERKNAVERVIEEFNLHSLLNKQFKHLSVGMKKRVSMSLTLLHDPKIVIVDEPTAGLDIVERMRFLYFLKGISQDKVIIITSHIADDIQFLCNRVGIIKNGRILYDGTVEDVVNAVEGKVWEIIADYQQLKTILLSNKDVLNINRFNEHLVKVRLLVNEPPQYGQSVKPSFSDGYMAILKERGRTT